MKKTLAAVLAAAMALSTATVAFATSYDGGIGSSDKADDSTVTETVKDTISVPFDKDQDSYLSLTTATDEDLDTGILAVAIEDGVIKASAPISSGRNIFSTVPTISTPIKDNKKVVRLRYKVSHSYGTKESEATFKIRFSVSKNYYKVAVATQAITKGDTLVEGTNFEYAYSTSNSATNVAEKDAKKGAIVCSGDNEKPVQVLKKGDIYTSEDYKIKAEYGSAYEGSDEVTITEKSTDSIVKLGDVYKELDSDRKISFWFDNNAVFDVKLSSADKTVNLYYDTAALDDVVEFASDYVDDIQFITFKASSAKFNNTGKLSFDATKNTNVYKYVAVEGGLADGDYLELQEGKYEDGILTISTKNLAGTWVIVEGELPVEDGDEPVDNAPTVEPEPETPAAPADEENPKTGAC